MGHELEEIEPGDDPNRPLAVHHDHGRGATQQRVEGLVDVCPRGDGRGDRARARRGRGRERKRQNEHRDGGVHGEAQASHADKTGEVAARALESDKGKVPNPCAERSGAERKKSSVTLEDPFRVRRGLRTSALLSQPLRFLPTYKTRPALFGRSLFVPSLRSPSTSSVDLPSRAHVRIAY